MFFGGEIILFACGTIALATVDRLASSVGFSKTNKIIKVLVMAGAIILILYFFETSAIVQKVIKF